jgi:hypothetical protein
MHNRLYPFIVILFLTSCEKKPPMPPAANNKEQNETPRVDMSDKKNDPPRAELRIGGDNQDEAPHLSFKITAVHQKRKPSMVAPFHVEGGDWTYFDCQAKSNPKVIFTVGVLSKGIAGDVPIGWGNATFIVKDQETGASFVELFSKVFAGKLPTPVKRAYAPRPLSIRTAILGQNIHRERQGGFSGEGGSWTATKWFPEHDGESGEVYFNYDLENRVGEFSEKEDSYADPLVAVFASALRDGPRPERTPENDPNLTLIGPKIGQPRKLLSRRSSHYCFSPNGQFVVYQDGSTVLAFANDNPDSKPLEIVRFDHPPWTVHVVDNGLNLVVQEGIPETPGIRSSADPMRIWWVDGKSKEKKLLRGPEKNLNLAENPVSPDQRYVVLSQWRVDPGKEGRSEMLHFLDRASGNSVISNLKPKDLSVIGWKKTEVGLRVTAVTNRWQFDKKEPSELYFADPTTGKLERQNNVDPRLDIDNPLSPDGRHRVRVGKEDLIVTDVDSGKQMRFVFHEYDRRFIGSECIEWVSPRYLKFNGPRLALIDVTMMKMCFPTSADGMRFGSNSYTFSSDFRWVLYQGEAGDGEGLFLAPVEMPRDGGQ